MRAFSVRRGSALLYVFMLGIALLILTSALLYRLTFTLRCVTHDESYIRARFLADTGASLALALMKSDYTDWETKVLPQLPLTSETLLSPNYAPEVLGGRFSIHRADAPQAYPEGAAAGSYVTLVCTGYSGIRRAQTFLTLKVTSPLVNFLMFSRGNLCLGGWGDPVIEGPILVNADGDEGSLQIWHDSKEYKSLYGAWVHYSRDPTVNSDIKASGKIFLRSRNDQGVWSREPLYFSGKTSAGSTTIHDIPGEPNSGALHVTSELNAQPDMEAKVKIPTTQELMDGYRNKTDRITIDVGYCATGVLAEFTEGGTLFISRAEKKVIGKIFDKDLYLEYRDDLVGQMKAHYHTSDTAFVDQLLRNAVAWDDPDYPETPYPADLVGDIDGDGTTEGEGDFVEVTRPVRGAELARVSLTSTSWKTIYLRTNRTDYSSEGALHGPLLYVRGNVRGKAVLVYDVTDDAIDPEKDRLHTLILAQDEDPADSALHVMASGAPGVPGGIRYNDPNVRLSRTQSTYSRDGLLLVSRGSVSAAGDTGIYKKRVRDPSGTIINYSQQLETLNSQYKGFYGGTYDPKDLTLRSNELWNSNELCPAAYGVFVGSHADARCDAVSHEGVFVHNKRTGTKYNSVQSEMKWSELATRPAGCDPGRMAIYALRFRDCIMYGTTGYRLKGSMSSLLSSLDVGAGSSWYDYSFSALSPEEIQSMGLPLTVITCSWQRQ